MIYQARYGPVQKYTSDSISNHSVERLYFTRVYNPVYPRTSTRTAAEAAYEEVQPRGCLETGRAAPTTAVLLRRQILRQQRPHPGTAQRLKVTWVDHVDRMLRQPVEHPPGTGHVFRYAGGGQPVQ